MNINIKKFLRSLKISPHKKVAKEATEYIHPLRDWALGLSFAVIVFCIGVGLIGYDFYIQFSAQQDVIVPEDQIVKYPEKEVLKYVEEYKKRDELFAKLRAERPYIAPKEEETVVATSSTPTP